MREGLSATSSTQRQPQETLTNRKCGSACCLSVPTVVMRGGGAGVEFWNMEGSIVGLYFFQLSFNKAHTLLMFTDDKELSFLGQNAADSVQ